MIHSIAYTAVALFLLTLVGNWACRLLFAATGMTGSTPPATPRAGRVIGTLERLVLALGIITHSWEILAALIALKTVARFRELDDQTFAEYFLVGSLFSILWAVFITGLWTLYDGWYGANIATSLTNLLAP